jgi:heat shock protein HslJ
MAFFVRRFRSMACCAIDWASAQTINGTATYQSGSTLPADAIFEDTLEQATGGGHPPAPQGAPDGLEGTSWNAIELEGTAVAVDAADRRPHLVFGAGGRLSGADGCNRLTGTYATSSRPLQ